LVQINCHSTLGKEVSRPIALVLEGKRAVPLAFILDKESRLRQGSASEDGGDEAKDDQNKERGEAGHAHLGMDGIF
jgi:hypothetical protein